MNKTQQTNKNADLLKFFQTHPPAPLNFERGASSGVGLAVASRQKRGSNGIVCNADFRRCGQCPHRLPPAVLN